MGATRRFWFLAGWGSLEGGTEVRKRNWTSVGQSGRTGSLTAQQLGGPRSRSQLYPFSPGGARHLFPKTGKHVLPQNCPGVGGRRPARWSLSASRGPHPRTSHVAGAFSTSPLPCSGPLARRAAPEEKVFLLFFSAASPTPSQEPGTQPCSGSAC